MDTEQLQQYLAKAKEPNPHNTTAIEYQGKLYPLLQRHSVNVLADKVLHGLEANQYQNLVVCGKSGSGKTTFVTNLLHNMVCKREKQWLIKWHKRDDIHNLDKIIKELPKGVPTILILDDVSYELDEISPVRRKEIFKTMTTIRHEVKSQILVIFITHYSRSLQKYLRSDADFTVLLSLSSSELNNWTDIFGQQAKWKLGVFQKQYARSLSHGSFICNFEQGNYTYGTNKPFRISLVNEYGVDLHSCLFTNESCQRCSLTQTAREAIEPKQFLEEYQRAYRNCYRQVLQYYAFVTYGKKEALATDKVRAWQFLQKLLGKYDIDIEAVIKLAESKKRTRQTARRRAELARHEADMLNGTRLNKNETKILTAMEIFE